MTDIPTRGFPKTEFVARTIRAQQLMAEQGFDGLLLMTEPEVRYFSGFQTLFWQSPTRPWFLFVPAMGKPVAVIPEIGADLMRRTWVEDIRTWSAPSPNDDGISLLTELLMPLANRSGTIGIMKGHETSLRMPLGDYERLMKQLSGLKVADTTDVIRSLRMIKSNAEIEKLTHICAIGSRSFAQVPNMAHEGQAFEDLFRSFRREALSQGADDIPYLVGGADLGGYRDVISPPTGRALSKGDIFMLDTGVTWDGYFCDFDRNFAIGHADGLSLKAYDVLWHATQAGIEAAKPGVTCKELFQIMRNVIIAMDDQGSDVGRLGHGLGMQLTEWPSLAAFDDTVVQEKMVLTLEPSLSYGDGRIMVHEENILVQAEGARLLSNRAAPELPVI